MTDLRRLRKKIGLRMRDAADLVGTSRERWGRWERELVDPPDTVVRWLKLFLAFDKGEPVDRVAIDEIEHKMHSDIHNQEILENDTKGVAAVVMGMRDAATLGERVEYLKRRFPGKDAETLRRLRDVSGWGTVDVSKAAKVSANVWSQWEKGTLYIPAEAFEWFVLFVAMRGMSVVPSESGYNNAEENRLFDYAQSLKHAVRDHWECRRELKWKLEQFMNGRPLDFM